MKSRFGDRKGAFTLIELMIVVAIIAIIAAIAIPKLVMAKRSANEGAATGNLETIANAQTVFLMAKIVDQDSDDSGEFGLLGELSGEIIPRTETAVLSSAVAPAPQQFNTGGSGGTDGCVGRTHYYYRIYLARTDDGAGTITLGDDLTLGGLPGTAGASIVDSNAINDQELHCVAYAWPEVAGKTGNRTFAITEGGNSYWTEMVAGLTYQGRGAMAAANTPNATAIYTGVIFNSPLSSSGVLGNDGNQWQPSGG